MNSLQNLHTHTTYCDGKDTPEEMVLEGLERGFHSIGFSIHSYVPHSKTVVIPLEQIEDPEDPNLFAYAVGEIRNNITYYTIQDEAGSVTSPVVWRIDDKTYAMNDSLGNITNNYVIRNDMSDFPGYNNGDFTMATNASAKELCPDFKDIPFDEIGRID